MAEIPGWRDDKEFCAAVQVIIMHEGGWQHDPRDRGNWTGGEVGRGECKGTKYGISAASYPALDIEILVTLALVPVCSPSFLKRHGPLKTAEHLARVPLIHDETFAPRARVPTWTDWFRAAGVAEPRGPRRFRGMAPREDRVRGDDRPGEGAQAARGARRAVSPQSSPE